MRVLLAIGLSIALFGAPSARAQDCPGHPDAIGTSRVLVIDPAEHARLGIMQYAETLPLADKEVVLTFDDGPLPPHTNRILDILAAECVKATFFLIGRMASEYPDAARKIHQAGHTIGTHSQDHPFRLNRLPLDKVEAEIDEGIASVTAALGDANALAPFFRIPGLARNEDIDNALSTRGLVTFSADFVADDWFHHIKPSAIVQRAMSRIEARGKGILLLHDIHAATVEALPELLRQLKEKGYRIVHVVPVSPDRQETATVPDDWLRNAGRVMWPRVLAHGIPYRSVLPTPSEQVFGIGYRSGPEAAIGISSDAEPSAAERPDRRWPGSAAVKLPVSTPQLPAPSPPDIGVSLDGRHVVGEPVGLPPRANPFRSTPEPAAKPTLKDTRAEAEPGTWPPATRSR